MEYYAKSAVLKLQEEKRAKSVAYMQKIVENMPELLTESEKHEVHTCWNVNAYIPANKQHFIGN